MTSVSENNVYSGHPFLPVKPCGIPEVLRGLPQWVTWIAVPSRQHKPAKKPINPRNRGAASVTDRRTWCDFDAAFDLYSRGGYSGVGFVFTSADPYVGLDLDDCRDWSTGTLNKYATDLLGQVNTYTETSPSGTGVKAIGIGRIDEKGPFRGGTLEVYDRKRFFALTGARLSAYPESPQLREVEFQAIQESIRPPTTIATTQDARIGTGLSGTDDDLLRCAFAAANGRRVRSLWAGDWSTYPSPSEAVLALLRLLAFWTGPEPDRLDRLFRRSGLYSITEGIRPKWDKPRSGGTWGTQQLAKAISTCPEFFNDRAGATALVGGEKKEDKSSKRQNCVSMVCIEKGEEAPGAREIKGRTERSRNRKQNLLDMIWQLCRRRMGGHCFLSILDAAPRLGVNPSTVSRWLREFRKAGLIRRTHWGSGRSGKASEYIYLGGFASKPGFARESA